MAVASNTHAVSCPKNSIGNRESLAIEDFVDAMAEQHIRVNPADVIADGKLHRIHADGDGKTVKDGWYVLHADDTPAGKFGHNGKYGYDVSFSWSMKVERAPMSADEKRAYREKMDAERTRREAEEAARHAAAAALANRIWDAAATIVGDDLRICSARASSPTACASGAGTRSIRRLAKCRRSRITPCWYRFGRQARKSTHCRRSCQMQRSSAAIRTI